MAILTYLDASGDEYEPALSVSGFLARPEEWQAFEAEWIRALKSAGVKEFHMKECAHFRGPFEGWDEKRRLPFLDRLTDIMNNHTLQSVGTSLIMSDYNRLNEQVFLREAFGHPYALTGAVTIALALSWRDANYPGEPISFLVEQGDRGQGDLIDLLNRFGVFKQGISVTPKPKRWTNEATGEVQYCYPFQACDFIAYEHTKATRTALDLGFRSLGSKTTRFKARKSLYKIAPKAPAPFWQYIDTLELATYCKAFGVYPRSEDLRE